MDRSIVDSKIIKYSNKLQFATSSREIDNYRKKLIYYKNMQRTNTLRGGGIEVVKSLGNTLETFKTAAYSEIQRIRLLVTQGKMREEQQRELQQQFTNMESKNEKCEEEKETLKFESEVQDAQLEQFRGEYEKLQSSYIEKKNSTDQLENENKQLLDVINDRDNELTKLKQSIQALGKKKQLEDFLEGSELQAMLSRDAEDVLQQAGSVAEIKEGYGKLLDDCYSTEAHIRDERNNLENEINTFAFTLNLTFKNILSQLQNIQ